MNLDQSINNSLLSENIVNMIPLKLFKASTSLQRSLVQNIRLRAMSVQAPTFSSSGDTENIVTKLGPNRIATMIITGKPNRPLPASYNVDVEEFLPGAISAVSVVTNAMAEDDWEALPGLVESRCVSNLRPVMSALSPEERELTRLNSADVFLSFISNPENYFSIYNLKFILGSGNPKFTFFLIIVVQISFFRDLQFDQKN